MAARESKLITFANIGAQWAPCGQLNLTEEGSTLIASSFAYGLNYLKRNDARTWPKQSKILPSGRDSRQQRGALQAHGLQHLRQ
jgi:hypothetical protein